MNLVEDNLQEQRPSRDEEFTSRVMDDLVDLTESEVWMLWGQVAYWDLVVALRAANEEVREKLLRGMRERNRGFIERDVEAMGSISTAETEQALKRVSEKVPNLAQYIPQLSAEYLSMKNGLREKLEHIPSLQLGLDDIAELFTGMIEVSQREGVLALHELEEACDNGFFRRSLGLLLDGCEPTLLREKVEADARSLPNELEAWGRMVFAGIDGISEGVDRGVMETRMRSFKQ